MSLLRSARFFPLQFVVPSHTIQNAIQCYLTRKHLDFSDDVHNGEDAGANQLVDVQGMELSDALEEFEKHFILKALEQTRGHRKKQLQC